MASNLEAMAEVGLIWKIQLDGVKKDRNFSTTNLEATAWVLSTSLEGRWLWPSVLKRFSSSDFVNWQYLHKISGIQASSACGFNVGFVHQLKYPLLPKTSFWTIPVKTNPNPSTDGGYSKALHPWDYTIILLPLANRSFALGLDMSWSHLPLLVGWRPSLVGWRSLLGWRPSL